MIVIGLTGGIASGKSFVAQRLAGRGAVVLDADRHAHAALEDAAIVERLVERWGEAILDENAVVRRSEVASQVFGGSESAAAERRFLEGLVHPWVRERLDAELAAAEAVGVPAAVLDIPLLFEAGWADRCDVVVFVEAPDEVRQCRAAERGWTPAELADREAAQLPLAEKRARSGVIVNGVDAERLDDQVSALWTRHIAGG